MMRMYIAESHDLKLPSPIVVPYNDTMTPSNQHLKTLRALFEVPVRSDVAWREVETLLRALGAELTEGRGSRLRFYLNGIRAVLHRPHPQKEIDRGAVISVKHFLTEAGIQPEE